MAVTLSHSSRLVLCGETRHLGAAWQAITARTKSCPRPFPPRPTPAPESLTRRYAPHSQHVASAESRFAQPVQGHFGRNIRNTWGHYSALTRFNHLCRVFEIGATVALI
jgi:hypothetical protein